MRLSGRDLTAIRGLKTVFSGISFTLEAGELLAVTGPNGSGKSTLLRLVAGLLRPAVGAVTIDPADGQEGLAHLVHYLGHLDALKSALTVGENIDFWRRFWGGGEVAAALERVGIAALANLPVAVLSAGQKRRAAMARLILVERPLWLLDEPLTALDAAGANMLGELLAGHLKAGGSAIAATHRDLPVAATATLSMGARG